MTRKSVATALLTVVAIGLGLLGQVALKQPIELPPDQREAILEAITQLEEILTDRKFGCGQADVELGWTGYQLARFVAGRLAGLGYPTKLARAEDRWWVLVGVDTDGIRFWVPVVPGVPAGGDTAGFPRGMILGHVPWDGTGNFEPLYLAPDEVSDLPPNEPPSGFIRALPPFPAPGERVRFFGGMSLDPDGVIVLFRWDFGDGDWSLGMNATHAYDREGVFTVTLTLIDDAGAETVASKTLRVRAGDGGCGCGG